MAKQPNYDFERRERDRLKKLDGVSDDEKARAEKELQKLTDDHIAKVEALLKAKEAEILAV